MYFNFTLMALAVLFLGVEREQRQPPKPRRGWFVRQPGRVPRLTEAASRA